MFSWLRKEKGDKTGLEMDFASDGQQEQKEKDAPTQDEQHAVAKIESDKATAMSSRENSCKDTGYTVEDDWEDEYKIYKGGGLQWSTNFAHRSKRARQIRPNSEDNFVFNAITIKHANITADTPEVCIYGVEGDDTEIAQKLTDISRFNDNKNNFKQTWKKLVYDFLGSGPTIAKVIWDESWIGGRGPERWNGDVRVQRVDKWDFYPDPAITNLIDNLQDCGYIMCRYRKKLKYIADRWEKGKLVGEQMNEDEFIFEGSNPEQAYVIEYWHKGFPWFVPDDQAKELREKAIELEREGDTYKANNYYDSAKGILEGVHVAYVADGVLLEYRPYEYEHGQYPFVFTTNYFDEKNQWGFGEIRNVKIPQINHNKADEIELEATSREGLGGFYYQKGAINPKQIIKIQENSGKGGMAFEVDNVNLMKDRTGVKVPASLTNYKEHKQRMVENISGNTDIMQGQSPGANIPFASIQELGARSDARTKGTVEKLEDFLIQVNRLRIELFAQFYTEDRYYRIRGTDGNTTVEGTMNSNEMMREWVRETEMQEQVNPVTGMPEIIQVEKKEKFVPEFDVSVIVMSEKPTDRGYYTQLAKYLYEAQLISPEDMLNTLEEGKLPPTQDLIERLQARQPILGIMAQMQEMPPEVQQLITQQIQQTVQGTIQSLQQPQMMQPQQAPVQLY